MYFLLYRKKDRKQSSEMKIKNPKDKKEKIHQEIQS